MINWDINVLLWTEEVSGRIVQVKRSRGKRLGNGGTKRRFLSVRPSVSCLPPSQEKKVSHDKCDESWYLEVNMSKVKLP